MAAPTTKTPKMISNIAKIFPGRNLPFLMGFHLITL